MRKFLKIDYKHPMSENVDQQIVLTIDIDVISGWCRFKCTRETLDDLVDIAKAKGMAIKLED